MDANPWLLKLDYAFQQTFHEIAVTDGIDSCMKMTYDEKWRSMSLHMVAVYCIFVIVGPRMRAIERLHKSHQSHIPQCTIL